MLHHRLIWTAVTFNIFEGCPVLLKLHAMSLKGTMINRSKVVTVFLLLSITSVVKAQTSQTVTVGPPETVMTPTQRTNAGLSQVFPDGNLGVFQRNGLYNVWAPRGDTDNSEGLTLTDLNNWLSGLTPITTTTNISHGGAGSFDQNYSGGGAVYYDSATGILIQLYHGEFWYNPSVFYAGLGLAYSNDLGVTWNKLGEVISPQTARSGNCQVDLGAGPLVVVGTFLYTYFVDESTGCNGGNFNIAVARAPIASVIAAAQAGTPFTSGAGTLFMKYTGNGNWNGNGVTDLANPQNGGGAFAALTTGNSYFVPNVAFNSFLNQYVLVYSNSFASLEVRFSSDGLTWGSPTTIVSGGGVPPNGIFYPTLLNTSGGDPETLGSTFYVYYVDPFGDWSQSNLKRVQVTLGSRPDPPTITSVIVR